MSSPASPVRLGVNIDHVATVRQARRGHHPDPVAAAALALSGGADGITIHLREDRRHIQDRDARMLREFLDAGLNLELAATDSMVEFACGLRPDEATLVPERREELTTEGGLDVVANEAMVARAVERLAAAGVVVAPFIDPDPRQIDICHALEAQAVEIQTARYSEARSATDRDHELAVLRDAVQHARDRGLRVHLGHGLDYANVWAVARLPGVLELNIGHSIISRAVLVGIERAVREMKQAIRHAAGH